MIEKVKEEYSGKKALSGLILNCPSTYHLIVSAQKW